MKAQIAEDTKHFDYKLYWKSAKQSIIVSVTKF